MLSRTIELHNGVHLPRVGLGTFKAGGQELSGAVVAALNVGIRHIDTALIYKNQPVIAAAMAQQPVARKEVFITSKVSHADNGIRACMPSSGPAVRCLHDAPLATHKCQRSLGMARVHAQISPYQQGTEKAKAACEEILSQLGTDSVVRLWLPQR